MQASNRIGESGLSPFRRHPLAWGAAAILLSTALAYLPALRAGFVWDDDVLLTRSPLIPAADGLRRFWFTGQAPDYWPLASTTLWAEWRLWGMHAAGYHATNLALHLTGSLLLWAVLRRLRLPGAFLAALLFAVHPVNVESVAWIAQRKDLLAFVCAAASVLAFLQAERGGGDAIRPGWHGLSLFAFVLALLSKSSVATLPLVLLGTIAWRRPLVRRDAIRLAPFLAAAAVLAAVEIGFQHRGAGGSVRTAGFPERLAGAGTAWWFYLGKAAAPLKLSFVYPQWPWRAASPAGWLPLLAAAGLAAALAADRRARPLRYAAGYTAVMLAPVLGFVDVHFMRYSPVADHYQHLALIGVVAVLAAGWAGWAGRAGSPLPLLAAAAAVAALGVLTWRQCETYRDAETLYRSALARSPDSWLVRNNLGELLHRQGTLPEAIEDFARAVRIRPDFAESRVNLGNALLQTGQPGQALSEFQAAVRLDPDSAEARNDLGNLLLQTGRPAEAIVQYQQALRINPAYAEAHNGLGGALFRSGRTAEAIGHYEAAVRLRPDYANARFDLGAALFAAGRYAEAAEQYREALRLRPGDIEARHNLRRAEFERELNAPAGGRP